MTASWCPCRRPLLLRSALLGLSAVLLSGCLGGGRPAPSDYFYQLGPPTEALRDQSQESPPVDTIVVRGLRSDGLRQERAMLYTREPQGLVVERLSYDFWADSPPELVKIYLVRSLRQTGLARLVTGDPIGRRPELEVGGRLLHFEQLRLPGRPVAILVELELQVEDARNGRVLWLESYRDRSTLDDDRMALISAGFRDALDRILARFVADLDKILAAR